MKISNKWQSYKSLIWADLYRYNGTNGWGKCLSAFIRKQDFRYVCLWRLYQSGCLHFLAWLMLRNIANRTCIEIGWQAKIEKGLILVHGGCIAINNEVTIGENCTLYHGVTIGMEFRGRRKGNPTLGNQVWVGPNASIVGNVKIGDDVLIAPNAYVNFDVPSHSIVIGNPGKIFQRDHATEAYINLE